MKKKQGTTKGRGAQTGAEQGRSSRRDKEDKILLALVDYHIRTAKPVGSQALQDESLLNMSAATIRNYFVTLEEAGYLKQQHISGGRIPQAKAYSRYAAHWLDALRRQAARQATPSEKSDIFQGIALDNLEAVDLVSSIQAVASRVAQKVSMTAIVSAPRFDRDSVVDVRYVYLDARRLLAVVVTEFGLVHTSIISLEGISQPIVKKAERFSRMQLFQESMEELPLAEEELQLIRTIYQETISSYFVTYSTASKEDVFRAGFLYLFSHPEFQDGVSLRPAISLFENGAMMRGLLREAVRAHELRYWIGNELEPYIQGEGPVDLSFIAAPYMVSGKAVGAFGVLGPMRVPYKELFYTLQQASDALSQLLTQACVKHRITFRMAETVDTYLPLLDSRKVPALEVLKPKRIR